MGTARGCAPGHRPSPPWRVKGCGTSRKKRDDANARGRGGKRDGARGGFGVVRDCAGGELGGSFWRGAEEEKACRGRRPEAARGLAGRAVCSSFFNGFPAQTGKGRGRGGVGAVASGAAPYGRRVSASPGLGSWPEVGARGKPVLALIGVCCAVAGGEEPDRRTKKWGGRGLFQRPRTPPARVTGSVLLCTWFSFDLFRYRCVSGIV